MSSRSPSSVKTECNQAKADFFDSQAQSAWAAAEYSEQERSRIFQVLEKLPDLRGNTVLEPGCGTGRLSRILSSQVGSQGLVIAMDISPKMIQAARENLQETNNVYLCCSALESMKLPLGEVDVVFCHQVFPHFDCKKTALAKMSRSLKPQAWFVILHLMGIEQINDLHRKAGTAVAKDMMPSQEEMRQLLRASGLKLYTLQDQTDYYLLLAQKP